MHLMDRFNEVTTRIGETIERVEDGLKHGFNAAAFIDYSLITFTGVAAAGITLITAPVSVPAAVCLTALSAGIAGGGVLGMVNYWPSRW